MNSSTIRRYLFPVLVLIALVSVSSIPYFFRSEFPQSWIQFIDIGTSVVLSVAVVFVYLSQNGILEKQTELMSSGYTPAIEVTNIDVEEVDTKKFASPMSSDSGRTAGTSMGISFNVANYGNNVATDMRVISYIYSDSDLNECGIRRWHQKLSIIPCISPVRSFSPRRIPLTIDKSKTEIRQSSGPVVPPNTGSKVRLVGNIGVNYGEKRNYCALPDAISEFSDTTTTVFIGFSLMYENAFNSAYELPLCAFEITGIGSDVDHSNVFDNLEPYPVQQLRDEIPYTGQFKNIN